MTLDLVFDYIRFIVLAEAGILLALTVRIIQSYYAVVRRIGTGQVSLLPRHVWKIGASYLMLIGVVVVISFTRLGRGLELLLPICAVALGVGISALIDMTRHQGTRYQVTEDE